MRTVDMRHGLIALAVSTLMLVGCGGGNSAEDATRDFVKAFSEDGSGDPEVLCSVFPDEAARRGFAAETGTSLAASFEGADQALWALSAEEIGAALGDDEIASIEAVQPFMQDPSLFDVKIFEDGMFEFITAGCP